MHKYNLKFSDPSVQYLHTFDLLVRTGVKISPTRPDISPTSLKNLYTLRIYYFLPFKIV